MVSSVWISSLRILLAVADESNILTVDKSREPTSLELTHLNKQCSRSAVAGKGHSLQSGNELGSILASRSSLGRILWRSFQRKLVASGPRPLSLALLQLVSQSALEEATSTLD